MKVIVDCDCGNDDSWAIISLLRFEQERDFEVIAITVCHGNTTVEHSVRNTLKVLEVCGRLDIPVYPGARSSLISDGGQRQGLFHGVDGLNDVYSEKPSFELAQKKHAVEAMRECIEAHPNDVTILTLAPLTNVALLYRLHPEVRPKIASLFVMGGNYMGVGNATKHSEFNFHCDPEAAHIVLGESACRLQIFPWEPCVLHTPVIPLREWRMERLASNDNEFTRLLDAVEAAAYANERQWMPCDAFMVATFIAPDIVSDSEERHVSVELAGVHTRGMLIVDHLRKSAPNATIVKAFDVERFKRLMLFVCRHRDDAL